MAGWGDGTDLTAHSVVLDHDAHTQGDKNGEAEGAEGETSVVVVVVILLRRQGHEGGTVGVQDSSEPLCTHRTPGRESVSSTHGR